MKEDEVKIVKVKPDKITTYRVMVIRAVPESGDVLSDAGFASDRNMYLFIELENMDFHYDPYRLNHKGMTEFAEMVKNGEIQFDKIENNEVLYV